MRLLFSFKFLFVFSVIILFFNNIIDAFYPDNSLVEQDSISEEEEKFLEILRRELLFLSYINYNYYDVLHACLEKDYKQNQPTLSPSKCKQIIGDRKIELFGNKKTNIKDNGNGSDYNNDLSNINRLKEIRLALAFMDIEQILSYWLNIKRLEYKKIVSFYDDNFFRQSQTNNKIILPKVNPSEVNFDFNLKHPYKEGTYITNLTKEEKETIYALIEDFIIDYIQEHKDLTFYTYNKVLGDLVEHLPQNSLERKKITFRFSKMLLLDQRSYIVNNLRLDKKQLETEARKIYDSNIIRFPELYYMTDSDYSKESFTKAIYKAKENTYKIYLRFKNMKQASFRTKLDLMVHTNIIDLIIKENPEFQYTSKRLLKKFKTKKYIKDIILVTGASTCLIVFDSPYPCLIGGFFADFFSFLHQRYKNNIIVEETLSGVKKNLFYNTKDLSEEEMIDILSPHFTKTESADKRELLLLPFWIYTGIFSKSIIKSSTKKTVPITKKIIQKSKSTWQKLKNYIQKKDKKWIDLIAQKISPDNLKKTRNAIDDNIKSSSIKKLSFKEKTWENGRIFLSKTREFIFSHHNLNYVKRISSSIAQKLPAGYEFRPSFKFISIFIFDSIPIGLFFTGLYKSCDITDEYVDKKRTEERIKDITFFLKYDFRASQFRKKYNLMLGEEVNNDQFKEGKKIYQQYQNYYSFIINGDKFLHDQYDEFNKLLTSDFYIKSGFISKFFNPALDFIILLDKNFWTYPNYKFNKYKDFDSIDPHTLEEYLYLMHERNLLFYFLGKEDAINQILTSQSTSFSLLDEILNKEELQKIIQNYPNFKKLAKNNEEANYILGYHLMKTIEKIYYYKQIHLLDIEEL